MAFGRFAFWALAGMSTWVHGEWGFGGAGLHGSCATQEQNRRGACHNCDSHGKSRRCCHGSSCAAPGCQTNPGLQHPARDIKESISFSLCHTGRTSSGLPPVMHTTLRTSSATRLPQTPCPPSQPTCERDDGVVGEHSQRLPRPLQHGTAQAPHKLREEPWRGALRVRPAAAAGASAGDTCSACSWRGLPVISSLLMKAEPAGLVALSPLASTLPAWAAGSG